MKNISRKTLLAHLSQLMWQFDTLLAYYKLLLVVKAHAEYKAKHA